ncbi:spleen trypsin inhibitor I [Drosophila mojavensis]|uniref:BPTI/Kunitz inhibitor domain-containing protein n=1 Tax=Drosophila mojavensis TaxID=7230 RepID=B4KJZ3_DROMO|nr:spleen trypsin inhibitor I [Drosophila mojavensis]EDW12596.1 uncharacterized protein Dmoj_GI17756 [Drosophila mojavensis]
MCSKLSIIALTVVLGVMCVHSAAVDQSRLVVEKQEPEGPTTQLPAVDEASVPEQCHQPKVAGRCFALFYRFAYNLDTHACEEFIYGGCGGNSNNFNSKAECEELCLGKAETPAETKASATEQSPEQTTQPQQSAETTISAVA